MAKSYQYLLQLFIYLFLVSYSAETNGVTYYFSSSTGADSRSVYEAQRADTPWKSLQQLNSIFPKLLPGDSILFKRGDVFKGSFDATSSGKVNASIVISAYGIGKNPVITGLKTIEGWTLLNGNTYYAFLDMENLNMVTLDNIVRGMGRFPNSGYLNYERHTNNTSISDDQLSGTDWSGAEVVIRKYRWVIDRHIITSHSGNTLHYNALATYGNNNAYSPLDGNGYFIQGHLSTLDSEGEWYYNKSTKRLYMHFGTGTPSDKKVQASSMDRNFTVNSQSFITFDSLDFEGANNDGGYLVDAHHISFNNCNFRQQGGNGLYGIDVSHLTVKGGIIADALNNGLWVEHQGSFITVDGVTASNIGTIAGAGKSGDAAQEGISIYGDYTSIRNCSVINTGYNGITFLGKEALIEQNYVNKFCTIKDDGAGIYTYRSNGAIIKNNIVLNAIGAYEGAEWHYWEPFGKAVGIYLDGGIGAHNAKVIGNTVAHGDWAGIFINNNAGNIIEKNTIYNHEIQLLISENDLGKIKNTVINDNKFINLKENQKSISVILYKENQISNLGTFNYNLYATNDKNLEFFETTEDGYSHPYSKRSFSDWKNYSEQDSQSKLSSFFINNLDDVFF